MSQSDTKTSYPPWTLKQVPTEARNAAIMAATRAKQDIGAWVGRVILEAAQRELSPRGRAVLDPSKEVTIEGLAAQAGAADNLLKLATAADLLAKLPTDTRQLRGLRNRGLRLVRGQLAL